MIELLLLHNANKRIRNSKGEFPLDIIKVDDANRDTVLQLFQTGQITGVVTTCLLIVIIFGYSVNKKKSKCYSKFP